LQFGKLGTMNMIRMCNDSTFQEETAEAYKSVFFLVDYAISSDLNQ
jgi:hypothetical protein